MRNELCDARDLILHMWNELNLNIRTKWYKEHSKNHHRIQRQNNPDYDECVWECVCIRPFLFEHVCVYVWVLCMCVSWRWSGEKKYKLYSLQSYIKEDDKIKRERDRKIFVADEKKSRLKVLRSQQQRSIRSSVIIWFLLRGSLMLWLWSNFCFFFVIRT